MLTDHVSTLLFCPTDIAVENLHREGFSNTLNNGRLIPQSSPVSASPYPLVVNVSDVMCERFFFMETLLKENSASWKSLV